MLPYYKIITVPDLAQITQELDQAVSELITRQFDIKAVYNFNVIDTSRLLELSPALTAWLTAVGLKNNLLFAALGCCMPAIETQLHDDGLCTEAINFPVYNCEKGYSVWCRSGLDTHQDYVKRWEAIESEKNTIASIDRYSREIRSSTMYRHRTRQRLHLTDIMTADNPELARVSNQYPVWVNTNIPHYGINLSDKMRIILTMRFNCPINIDAL